MNLVGPVSPGTKQPTRKEDPRSAHTRSTFQPQNSSSQSNQCPDCPPIHTSGCHHDRVVDMQIVITTRLSHSSQLKQCGHMSCQFMGFVLAALHALADLAQGLLRETYSKNCVSNCRYLHFFSQQTNDCAMHTRKCRKVEKEACRKIRNVSLRFWPRSWPKTGRFADKKNLTPQTERETLGSINQSINQSSTSQFHLVQVHSSARPAGQGTHATETRIRLPAQPQHRTQPVFEPS